MNHTSWRANAQKAGIRAHSFDDYCDKLDAIKRQDKFAQQIAEAERKLSDAQLLHVDTTIDELHGCADCGKRGDDIELIEATRPCGSGYGEWYCRNGYGCQR